jgi:hypothetical protein
MGGIDVGFLEFTNFKLFNVLIVFSFKLMGTLNLLSAFLKEQPLFANICLNLIIFARFILLLLDFTK